MGLVVLLIIFFLLLPTNRNRLVLTALLVVGFIFISLNIVLIHETNNNWFAGSDATSLYMRAFLFNDLPNIIFETDNRYIGYTIFQFLASFPFIKNELIASVMIHFSNWVVWLLALMFMNRRIVNSFNFDLMKSAPFFLIANCSVLWVSLYNFRDVLIISLVTVLLATIIGFKRKDFFILIIISFILWYFRNFFVYIYTFSLVIAMIILVSRKRKNLFKLMIGIILLFALLTTIMPVQFFSNLATTLDDFRFFVVSGSLSPRELLRGITSSFLAGNPIKFTYSTIGLSIQRAFVVTEISSILRILVYFGTYTFLIPLFIILIFVDSQKLLTFKNNDLGNRRIINSKELFIITAVIFVTSVILIYSIFFGGTQERIRVVVLIPAAIIFEIFRRNHYVKNQVYKAFVTSMMIMLLFVVLNPL